MILFPYIQRRLDLSQAKIAIKAVAFILILFILNFMSTMKTKWML